MSAGSLARHFPLAGGLFSGRVSMALIATLFIFLLPAAASAYTLVLRSGRHVTVPDDFKVTPSAVIYETSPGFSVTVWLTNVDAAATERANAEPAGSFVRRIEQKPDEKVVATDDPKAARGVAQKLITNKELEPLRLRREAQEAEYERTRRERGMPSKQELQRRVEEQDRRMREWARESRAERAEAELESVRSELVNVRRELNEMGLRLSQPTGAYEPAYVYSYYYAPPVQFITRLPFGRRGGFRPHPHGSVWPYNPWRGHAFPSLGWPTLNGSTSPSPLAPAPSAPRR